MLIVSMLYYDALEVLEGSDVIEKCEYEYGYEERYLNGRYGSSAGNARVGGTMEREGGREV